ESRRATPRRPGPRGGRLLRRERLQRRGAVDRPRDRGSAGAVDRGRTPERGPRPDVDRALRPGMGRRAAPARGGGLGVLALLLPPPRLRACEPIGRLDPRGGPGPPAGRRRPGAGGPNEQRSPPGPTEAGLAILRQENDATRTGSGTVRA